MYLGQLVEIAKSDELYDYPLHPYTQALLSAIPNPYKDRHGSRIMLQGEVPSPINPPKGCRFASRCKYAKTICTEVEPVMKEVGSGHFCACHLYE